MNFQVDIQKKKKLQMLIIRNKKSLSTIKTIALLALWIGIVCAIIYPILNILIADWNVVNVNGIPKKDYLSIGYNSAAFLIFGSIIYLMLRALLSNLAGRDAGGRVDEDLILMNDTLRYTFRIKFQFAASHRNVIIIPIKDIASAKYDPKTNAIQLRGRFSSDSVDDYFSGEKITPESGNLKEFVLYDYFAPSLLNSLKSKGVYSLKPLDINNMTEMQILYKEEEKCEKLTNFYP